MVSRDTQVVIACGSLAILLLYVLATVTTVPTWVSVAVAIVVGVLLPQLITEGLEEDR